MRGHLHAAGLLALAIVVLCAPEAAAAERRTPVRVAVGELGRSSHAPAVDALFRRVLHDEVGSLSGVRAATPDRADVIVRGSLTSLDRSVVDAETRVRCEVSVIVADRKTGAMRMILRGRAEARGSRRDGLYRDAVEAAVRSALRPLANGTLLQS